jgi:putative membrane protein
MIETVAFVFLGLIVGLIAGILPGIHPNQVFVMLISLLPLFSMFSEYGLLSFILSITASNIIFNYIPSIFLSIPDSETVMNILPGHRMVLEGKGLNALFMSLSGSIFTLIASIITLPVLLFIIPILNNFLYPYLHFLLIGLTAWMVLLEKGLGGKLKFVFLYLISGFWGILTLNSVFISSDKALFPALTGMFGIAGLLMSLNENNKIPKQEVGKIFDIGNLKKIIISALVAGLLIGVLPGAGESQAGVLMSCIGKLEEKEFLSSLAGINSSNMFFAFISLYSFGKVRSGSAAAVKSVLGEFLIKDMFFSVGVLLFSAGISVIATWFLGKRFLGLVEKINYRTLSIIIIVFTVLMVILLTGFVGLFILLISTCIGILPLCWEIKRTSNMGYLMMTTTLYFTGLNWLVNGIIF